MISQRDLTGMVIVESIKHTLLPGKSWNCDMIYCKQEGLMDLLSNVKMPKSSGKCDQAFEKTINLVF